MAIVVAEFERGSGVNPGHGSRGRLRRRMLISAAAEQFREFGRDGITQRAVAHRANASLSAMTYYFADLADLLDRVMRRVLRDRNRTLIRYAAEPSLAGADAVEAIVNAVLPQAQMGERMVLENFARLHSEPLTGEEVGHMLVHVDAALAAIWAHFDLTAPLVPRQVVALVDGALLLQPHREDTRRVAAEAVSSYLDSFA